MSYLALRGGLFVCGGRWTGGGGRIGRPIRWRRGEGVTGAETARGIGGPLYVLLAGVSEGAVGCETEV